MLLDKYRPELLKDVIGNKEQIAAIKGWLKNWRSGTLLLCGPTGCGKSLCVELIAKEMGYELVESHASDVRSYKELKSSIMKAAEQQSLFYKKKLVLIDELERIDSARGVTEIVAESACPVILITSNPYEHKLSQLKRHCNLVRFYKINSGTIAAFLRAVCRKENIDDSGINQLAEMCNGDVRSALIDLESISGIKEMHRDKEESIFEALKILFNTLDISNSRYAIENCEKPLDELMLWVEENIPREYEDICEIAAAYDFLSKADVMAARIIKRQSWSLQKYCSILLCGVAFAKNRSYKKSTLYAFPRIRSMNRELDDIAEKISMKLHASRKETMQYLRLIALLNKKTDIAKKLGLSDDELDSMKELL